MPNSSDTTLLHQLQNLLSYNVDSVDGLRSAADLMTDMDVKQLFRQVADRRAANVEQLKGWLSTLGDSADESGTTKAAAHRAWLSVKDKLTTGDHGVLEAAEFGENKIAEAYDTAVKEIQDEKIVAGLTQQAAAVKQDRDRVLAVSQQKSATGK